VPQGVEDLGHVIEGRGERGARVSHMSKYINILRGTRKRAPAVS
jgi:hypothetical protein